MTTTAPERRKTRRPRVTFIESRTTPGVEYRIVAWRGVYECDCPARVECWHIREQRETDEADLAFLEGIGAMREVEERGLVPVNHQSVEVYHAPALGTALVTAEQFDMMWKIASTVIKGGAGMVPDSIKTPEAAMAVMLAGHEMGFPPFAALRLIFPVNGKMQMLTEAYIALVRQRDPTARFVFHSVSDHGADVELFRNGESVIRVGYSEAERLRAHQGMRLANSGSSTNAEWIPVRNPDNSIKKYPQGHAKAGKTMYERNPDYVATSGGKQWVEDPESAWTKHRADMYAWSACKRCVRFGASDLTNLSPRELPMLDETMLPTSSLSQALFGGQIDPAALDDDDETPYEGGDWSEERPANPPDGEPPIEDMAPYAPADDEEAATTAPLQSLEQLQALIKAKVLDCKATWAPADYGSFYRELSKYMPDPKAPFKETDLTYDRAVECLAELRQRRGEPPV